MATDARAPGRSVRRLAQVGALVLIWLVWVPVAELVLVFFGLSGQEQGWMWVAALLLPLVGVTWLCTLGLPHHRGITAVGAVVLLAVGAATAASATPDDERVWKVMQAVPAPSGQLVDEDSSGSSWCTWGCPEQLRTYAVADSATSVEELRRSLPRAGWGAHGDAEDLRWCRSDFGLRLRPWHDESGDRLDVLVTTSC